MNIDSISSNGTSSLRAPLVSDQDPSPKPGHPATSEPESSAYAATSMRVTKRSGRTEPVDLDKIVRAVSRCATGLADHAAAVACSLENPETCEACQ